MAHVETIGRDPCEQQAILINDQVTSNTFTDMASLAGRTVIVLVDTGTATPKCKLLPGAIAMSTNATVSDRF